jgi:hypothetical protein
MRRGAIGQVRRGRLAFVAEVRSLAHVLNQTVGRTFQHACDASSVIFAAASIATISRTRGPDRRSRSPAIVASRHQGSPASRPAGSPSHG